MFNVEIISSEGFLFQGQAKQVVVPVVSGEIGFLAGHESVVAELKEGKIIIFGEGEEVIKEIDAKAGVAEMHKGEKLMVLIDS